MAPPVESLTYRDREEVLGMEIKTIGDRTDYRFGHPTEAVEWLKSQDGRTSNRKQGDSYRWNSGGRDYALSYEWTGNATAQEVFGLAQTGWHTGTDDIVTRLESVKRHEVEATGGYYWDTTGLQFDVGQVLSGEPECWLEQQMRPAKKAVSICVNIVASAMIDGAKLARRGAAIIALVDTLQDAGYIVELTALGGFENVTNHKYVFCWFDFGTSPLDLDAAALVLAHPGWMRHAGIALMDCATGTDGGRSRSGTKNRAGICKDLSYREQESFDLYIPAANCSYSTGGELADEADAAKWVAKQIEAVQRREMNAAKDDYLG